MRIKFYVYICDIQNLLIMEYKVQVWFRYYRNGQSEKDSEIETVEADDEKQAKRKAADL